MDTIRLIAECVGFVVMAIAGIGAVLLLAYLAASEYFKFAVNRIGGFEVLKNYMIHRLEFYHWLQERVERKTRTPNER